MFSTVYQSYALDVARLKKHHSGIDIKLQSYVDDFIKSSDGLLNKQDLEDITMGFRKYPEDSTIIGTCWYMMQCNEIDINEEWFNNLYITELERRSVIYHELGHCVLGRGHTSPPVVSSFLSWLEWFAFKIGWYTPRGYLKDDCPVSLMHPYNLGYKCLKIHWKYYIQELYHNSKITKKIDINPEPVVCKDPHNIEMRVCNKPTVINSTSKWTKRDGSTLKRAIKTCIVKYKGCLKIFTKKDELSYTAICD